MRASRCSTQARTATGYVILMGTFLMSLLALALAAPPSHGATAAKTTRTPAKAETTSTSDEGITVRVIEDQAGGATKRIEVKGAKGTRRITIDTPDIPKPPDIPEVESSSNDLVRFGEDIVIPEDKVVEGDVVAFGGSITVLGRVKGSCTAIGGSVRVEGKGAVEGDAVTIGGTVSTGDSATVGGSNVSLGSFNAGRFNRWGPWMGAIGILGTGAWLAQMIFKVLLALLFGWLALVLFRDRILYANQILTEQFGKSFLFGLLGWVGMVFAVPVGIVALILFSVLAAVILCITIIGIPVAILVLIAMVLGVIGIVAAAGCAVFLAYMGGAIYLGQRVFGRRVAAKPLIALLVGAVLLALLHGVGDLIGALSLMIFHPLGILLGIAAAFLFIILTTAGLGSLVLSRFATGSGSGWSSQWGFGGRRPSPVTPGAPPSAGVSGAPPSAEPAASPAGVHEPRPVVPPPTPPPEGGTSDAP